MWETMSIRSIIPGLLRNAHSSRNVNHHNCNSIANINMRSSMIYSVLFTTLHLLGLTQAKAVFAHYMVRSQPMEGVRLRLFTWISSLAILPKTMPMKTSTMLWRWGQSYSISRFSRTSLIFHQSRWLRPEYR